VKQSGRRAEVTDHLDRCDRCRRLLKAIGAADRLLEALPPLRPGTDTVLATRRSLSAVTRGTGVPEILTLEEVAAFLRIEPEQLGEIVEELPAFELAGQIRVRRARLIEWVAQRERDHSQAATASWMARADAGFLDEGGF